MNTVEITETTEDVATKLYLQVVDAILAQIGERSLVPAAEMVDMLLDGRNVLSQAVK